MFTGIIEDLGTISKIDARGEGRRLTIRTRMDLTHTRIGDSIAVNGACLTAVTLNADTFTIDMAPETVNRTTFKAKTVGSRVNLERALRLSDRLDGHLVSGHIDGTGTVRSRRNLSNAIIIEVGISSSLAAEMIEKGSVALDGISLTLNQVMDTGFEISVIPHTVHMTTLNQMAVGDAVNIETDMLGKYVRRFLNTAGAGEKNSAPGGLSMEILARNGFL